MAEEVKDQKAWEYLAKKNFRRRLDWMAKGIYQAKFFAKMMSELICFHRRSPSKDCEARLGNAFVETVQFFSDNHWVEARNDLVSLEKARLQLMGLAAVVLDNVMHIDEMVQRNRRMYDFRELEELPDHASAEATDDAEGSVEEKAKG